MRPLSRKFNLEITQLEHIRQWMLAAFQVQDRLAPEAQHDVLVAVTEVFVNLFEHSNLQAQDTIEIRLDFTEEALVIVFQESGEPFDMNQLLEPDLDALHESGYGLFIVRSLTDTFEYIPKTPGKPCNITRMTKGYHGER